METHVIDTAPSPIAWKKGRTMAGMGMSDDEQWFRESEDWPKSYKVFRGSIPFFVNAPSEEEALLRLQQFQQFLEHLTAFGDDYLTHEAMTYVYPESMQRPISQLHLEFVEEHIFHGPDELRPSMASGELPQWTWLRPARDGDYDPEAIARDTFGFEDEDEE